MLHPSLKRKRGGTSTSPHDHLFRGFLGGLLSLLDLIGLLLGLFLGLFFLVLLLNLFLFWLLFFLLHILAVVSAEELLDLAIFDLNFIQSLFDSLEADLRVWLINDACLIFVGTKILDLLAAVLDLDKAQCGRGTLKEVTKGRQFIKVLGISVVRILA